RLHLGTTPGNGGRHHNRHRRRPSRHGLLPPPIPHPPHLAHHRTPAVHTHRPTHRGPRPLDRLRAGERTAMTDLHLARIRLNPASRDVQRDLADAKQLHTTLMRLLPDRLGPEPRRLANLLFRVETDQTGTTVLAQATHPLDPGRLPTGYGRSETKTLTP